MKTKSIKQTIQFNAAPIEVYELLMDEKKHGAITGSPAKMSKIIKGKFKIFYGYCTGHNIELEEGKKIVQAWHFDEECWPDDHFSICTFLFEPTEKGTRLTFTQTDVPESVVKNLRQGWKDFYWKPMAEYLK